MSKRYADPKNADGEEAYNKRQKIKHVATATEDIQSSRQLQQLLAFDQDVARAKHGIHSFKSFLDGFSDEDAKRSRLPILKDFLESQTPKDEANDTDSLYLEGLMQTWSFASQSNNDSLLSAVPAVLDLLLKNLSTLHEFTDYGKRLGRTLLQKKQLELLSRGLSAPKGKEYVISPALRLIREVLTFDGGALARDVFRARDHTFKSLGRNLGLRHGGEGVEDRRRPSVRTHAVRVFIACLKLLPVEAKKELLGQRDVVAGVMRDLSGDPPYLIREFLEAVRAHLVADEKLSSDAKSRFLNANTLGKIVGLYSYDREEEEVPVGKKGVDALAHEFLLHACTTLNVGVLRSQGGLYPKGVNPDQGGGEVDDGHIDLGLDSLEWADRFPEKLEVHNKILAEFIQSLRPWSDMKQTELLLAIFKAAPELVAHYYYGKRTFLADPKVSSTWFGYSALMFSTAQLPVPAHFGHQKGYARLPPPSTVVIESILPMPLTQKVLTRCLKEKDEIITFFAIRMLVVSFEKLQTILARYREAAATYPIWEQAVDQLKNLFTERCPTMKDIITAFNAIPYTNLLQKQAASKLLALYYETVPLIAFESKFDVSGPLSEGLRDLAEKGQDGDDGKMRVLTLESLFQVAYYSPGTRWFNKDKDASASPFTSMLQLSVNAESHLPLERIRSIVEAIIKENGILQFQTSKSSVHALISALRLTAAGESQKAVYEFLDNCLMRCAATPVKYIDALEQLHKKVYGDEKADEFANCCISLLHMVVVEQWPFVTKTNDGDRIAHVAAFIAHYIGASLAIGEDKKLVKAVLDELQTHTEAKSAAGKTLKGARKLDADIFAIPEPSSVAEAAEAAKAATKPKPSVPNPSKLAVNALSAPSAHDLAIEATFLAPPRFTSTSHDALTKCSRPDTTLSTLIEEGHASALVMLLSSSHQSIRRQALTELAKLAHRLKAAPATGASAIAIAYSERDTVWLLLCEVMETAKGHFAASSGAPASGASMPKGEGKGSAKGGKEKGKEKEKEKGNETPLPHTITSFAARAILVLAEPLHPLYAKINAFLTAGPVWESDKLPLLKSVLGMGERPTVDDALKKEVGWVLGYVGDGIPIPTSYGSEVEGEGEGESAGVGEAELEIIRRRRVVERALAIYENPYLVPSSTTPSSGGVSAFRKSGGDAGATGATQKIDPVRFAVERLLWRVAATKSGATMLVTRFGVLSWLAGRIAAGGRGGQGPQGRVEEASEKTEISEEGRRLRALLRKVLANADGEKVRRWMKREKGVEGVWQEVNGIFS